MIAVFPWKRALRSGSFWFSLLVMLSLALLAVLAPWLAGQDPYKVNVTHPNLPPMWVQTGSRPGLPEFPLGTDRYGRDVLSRLLYSTRTAFCLALTAVPLAALIGTLVGLIAGYAGDRFNLFTNITDLIQTLPGIMFMVIIILILRRQLAPTWTNGLLTLLIGFVAINWVSLARLVRISVLQVKSQLFVEAAVSLGASPWQVVIRHLLPNVSHIILVWVINNIPVVILMEALLGYIGVGVTSAVDGSEFSVISWGGMFFSGRSALGRNPLMLVIPSLFILLLSMSFFLLGDFLNDITRRTDL